MKKLNFRTLRISLKYRPEILKLILKMRLCIQRKNVLLKKLNSKVKQMKSAFNTINEVTNSNHDHIEKDSKIIDGSVIDQSLLENRTSLISMKDSSTQTEILNDTIDDSMPNQQLFEYQITPKSIKDSPTQTESLTEIIGGSLSDQLLLENKTTLKSIKDSSTQAEMLNDIIDESMANQQLFKNPATKSTKDSSSQTEILNVIVDNSVAEQPLLGNQNTPKITKDLSTQTEILNDNNKSKADQRLLENQTTSNNTKDMSIQTLNEVKDLIEVEIDSKVISTDSDNAGWDIKNEEGEKSIAEQVKEVAQSALQQTGMVYVESAGMYYDYKTGYYYNSELGLYYHTETGCYYYYSDEKQSFVFHSYPDRSAENTALAAHEKKKAKKHKKEQQKEVDINNLMKQMSQGEDEESRKPKRRKTSKKRDTKKPKKDVQDTKKDNPDKSETETAIEEDKEDETTGEKLEESNANGSNKEKEENQVDIELEDGECSETESDASSDEDCKSKTSTSTATDDDSIAKHHPPCMRIIVRETNLTKLKVGNLFLITKDGGTIGREGDQHAIVINDHGVSRNHLEIKYDMGKKSYFATDLGSKNGTILNGIRMSESQDISTSMEIMHGSTIQVGETKLLCHIHPGNDTCGHCEPGLIIESQEKQKVAYTRTCSVQKQHQLELARLKNKYAPKPLAIDSVEYNDRAQARRDTVGSSHHAEKTQSSDIDTFIPAENKGFKLLEKMGWSKGEGLGKDNQGGIEPIPLVSNEGTAGLGSAGPAPQPLPKIRITNTLGPATLRLAAKTKMLNKPAKAFQDQLEDEESE